MRSSPRVRTDHSTEDWFGNRVGLNCRVCVKVRHHSRVLLTSTSISEQMNVSAKASCTLYKEVNDDGISLMNLKGVRNYGMALGKTLGYVQ